MAVIFSSQTALDDRDDNLFMYDILRIKMCYSVVLLNISDPALTCTKCREKNKDGIQATAGQGHIAIPLNFSNPSTSQVDLLMLARVARGFKERAVTCAVTLFLE